uniref:ADP,ATP carrier protein n=1 Tax=Alexandrium monilatum TaxID=311494 RepID=A0A7S4S6P6_9DINO
MDTDMPAPKEEGRNQDADKPTVSHASSLSSKCDMCFFAASLVSPMACAGITFFGKDIYILKFGADVGLMSAVGTVLAIVAPVINLLTGWCMEKIPLSTLFPWATWGRRAPWYLTHLVLTAFSTAALFLPVSFDPTFLCWWYLALALCSSWCLSVSFIAFESARLEAYATKEERTEVEAVCKISGGAGAGTGILLPLIVAAGASRQVLQLMGLVALLVGLFSLVSIPVLRKARLVFQPDGVGSFLSEFVSLLRVSTVWHLMAYRFTEDLLTTVAITATLYWVTFVEGLTGTERSLFIALSGAAVAFSTIVMLPCWTQFFRIRRQGVNINVFCSRVMALGLLAPVVLVMKTALPSGVGFLAYIVLMQGSVAGQTFWRVAAMGWVVDEDCHAGDGKRREALLIGLVGFFASAGRAVGVGIVLLGLAYSGMESTNCDLECEGKGPSADGTDCVAACDAQNLDRQPPMVSTFLHLIYYAVVTTFQVIAISLVYSFPICNARLDAIYAKQAELAAAASAESGAAGRPQEARGQATPDAHDSGKEG